MDSRSTTERERQINEVIEAALSLAPHDRAAYLDNACADEALHHDVETIITRRESPGPLNGAINAERSTALLADDEIVKLSKDQQRQSLDETTIGPYRILRRIGQGGMGAVYLAERDDAEFKHQVAIKLVKRGMDTEFVLRRFRDERQILAALNHPNIARLLDGGTTSDGRPYFVMEYIEGKPITQYADEQRLSTLERLSLFQGVCAAIHYAHQNLVIHRDIKPSNILVIADGTLKLLDFGIAKLLNSEIAGHTIEATDIGIRLMTPEYASPEQVKGEPITTASDVYSLGVLLYELLTGHLPYRISNGTPQEIARVVCEKEPPKPSTAVGHVEIYSPGDGKAAVVLTPEDVSRTREGNPDKLRRRLAGDLDNIVLMAMRKEPVRRYGSVDRLASDIDRHLKGRPVTARKDTLAYRTSKFVKRHKAGALAVLLILISLIVGTVTTLQQRARAESRFNDVRKLATSFLFEFHDAIKDLPGSTLARELIVKRALEYLDSLALEASGDIQLQRELATAYQQVGDVQGNPYDNNLGNWAGGLASYQKALAIREEMVKQNPSNAEDRRGFAVIYLRIGQLSFGMGHTEEAVEASQKGIGIAEELLENDPLDFQTSRVLPPSYRNLALALARRGNLDAGFDIIRKGQSLCERLLAADPNDPQALYYLSANLGVCGEMQMRGGDLADAMETLHKVLPINERLVAAYPNTMLYKTAFAITHMNIGNTELLARNESAAAESFRKMLAIMEQAAATDKKNARVRNLVAIAEVNLGRALVKLGQSAEGLMYQQRAAVFFKQAAADNPLDPYAQIQMAYTDMQVSVALATTGKGAQALELGDKARTAAEQLTATDPTSVELRGAQAGIYLMFGDVHASLAASERQASKQADRWRAARNWYQHSYELLQALKDRGEWTDPEYGTPNDLAAKIAQCDTALAKLKVSSK